MNNAPNLIEYRSKKTNTVRNVLFLCLCLGVGAWYGFRFSTEYQEFIPSIAKNISSDKAGGDITVELEEKRITVPVKITTSTLDSAAFSAPAIFVKDVETGETLFAKNEYIARPIASITKLMSAIVLLDNGLNLNSTSTAANGELFDTFLQPHLVYDTTDVWNAALIGSSNRGILTLVDSSGMTREEFVSKMNQKAAELGMSDTAFTDPTGLDVGNVASASDVLILLKEALSRPLIYDTLAKKEYAFATIASKHARDIYNTNWLLLGWIPNDFPVLLPGKTGFIPESGYNFTTGMENEAGRQIHVVVLGAANHEARFEEARDAATWVFANYEWQEKIIMVPKKISEN